MKRVFRIKAKGRGWFAIQRLRWFLFWRTVLEVHGIRGARIAMNKIKSETPGFKEV